RVGEIEAEIGRARGRREMRIAIRSRRRTMRDAQRSATHVTIAVAVEAANAFDCERTYVGARIWAESLIVWLEIAVEPGVGQESKRWRVLRYDGSTGTHVTGREEGEGRAGGGVVALDVGGVPPGGGGDSRHDGE